MNANDKFKAKIEEYFTKLKDMHTIQVILANFTHTSSHEIFMSSDYWVLFEYALLQHNPIGKGVLWSSDSDINYVESLKTQKTLNIDCVNNINIYIKNEFNMLIKLIIKNIDLELNGEEITYLTLRLLQHVIIKYSSEMFYKLYESIFTDVELLSFEECVDIFLSRENTDSAVEVEKNLFIYFLMNNEKFFDNTNFLRCKEIYEKYIIHGQENIKFRQFERKLTKEIPTQIPKYSLNDIDLMSGEEFEKFVSLLFSKLGYFTEITKHSFDQGIDIVAKKNGENIGIQAKCYSNTVSNSAVQEVVAGLKYYDCQKGIVITNIYFTKSAKELASSNNIKLWGRKILDEKIREVF